MNLQELVKDVQNGSITVHTNKHEVNSVRATLKDHLAYIKESVEETLAEGDTRLHDFYVARYAHPINKVNRISDCETQCFGCGATLHLYLIDGKIELVDQFKYRNYRNALQESSGIDRFTPLANLPKELRCCPAAPLKRAKGMTTSINIPSGKVLIQNFILDDNIEDPRSANGVNYNISSLDGRNNMMQYYGGLDIGYGQMGNMYMDVLVNADGTEIIFAADSGFDDDGEEIEYSFPGFNKLGEISNDMWRWMCADKEVLNNLGYDYNSYDRSQVWVEVMPGSWDIEHYYDVVGDRSDGVYSRLRLKK